MPPWLRARLPYVALALGTAALGLAVHVGARRLLAPAVHDVLGDALWAAMMAWWVGALAPARPWHARAVLALGVCFAVEASQAYRAPALDALRRTTIGHLVLGSDFDARDLAAYALGVLAAVLLEHGWRRHATPRPADAR